MWQLQIITSIKLRATLCNQAWLVTDNQPGWSLMITDASILESSKGQKICSQLVGHGISFLILSYQYGLCLASPTLLEISEAEI